MNRIAFLLICIICCISQVFAQEHIVTGRVTDADKGSAIQGVSVVVDGTTVGSITDNDGKYSIHLPQEHDVIVFSFVGMKTHKQKVEGKAVVNVALTAENVEIDELIVVAYGTQKKSSFTGSSEVIKSEDLADRPISSAIKALDGKVAGVQSTIGQGQPGSGISVMVRGFGSINSSTSPLYVVDGIPFDGSISSINTSDVESITVLKDASASALYGARGSNGVVMITTKHGTAGNIKVNLKANWGVSSRALPEYETLDEKGYIEYVFQSYKNDQISNNGLTPDLAAVAALLNMQSGTSSIFGDNEQYNPFNYKITELVDPTTGKVRSDASLKYHDDWMDEALSKNPIRQDYSISLTGGDAKTKYLFSTGYLSEDGILKTTNFKRYSGRFNIDSNVNNWFKAGMSANFSRNIQNYSNSNNTEYSNIWYSSLTMGPIFPVYEKDADGNTVKDQDGNPVFDYGINRPAGGISNSNCIASLYDDKNENSSDNVSSRLYASFGGLKTGVLKGLKLTLNYGFDLQNSYEMTYENPDIGDAANIDGRISKSSSRLFSFTTNQLLSYDRKIEGHTFDILIGHEFYKYHYESLSAEKTGFPFSDLYELGAATSISDADSYTQDYAVESVLSRINYNYNDKYYLSASLRSDGSSRFHEDNRWGIFWSAGANWRMSEEDFMINIDWIDNLSLKASYGILGNDDINSIYAWQSIFNLDYSNATMSGATVSSLENKDLRWEKNATFNIGVETRLFDRISASIEWYNRLTSDMLLNYPMASSLGFDGYYKNAGSMRNRGFDISVGIDIFKESDFKWNLNLIASTVNNKVIELTGDENQKSIISGIRTIIEDEEIYSFYTAKSAGVDPATGEQLYWVDIDDNGKKVELYASPDQTLANQCKSIQGSRIPDVYGSFSNELKYKGFDLNILFNYSLGGLIYDQIYGNLLNPNYVGESKSKDLERAWKEPGDVTDIHKAQIGKTYISCDDMLINASYLSLKNITLGYTLPRKWTKSIDLESVRFTASGENIFMLTHLKGMNPQYNFTGGTDFSYVPVRTVTLGIDIKF